jgi:hypothetical protein
VVQTGYFGWGCICPQKTGKSKKSGRKDKKVAKRFGGIEINPYLCAQ